MRAVVVDTGPLHYLVLIDEFRILPALLETVFVPEAVRTELMHPETPLPVRKWISEPPPWLVVRPDVGASDGELQSLDPGEREAITLALSLGAELILMDDRAAVAAARRKGLVVTGTIGLLDLAARRGMVDLARAFERLRKTTFHYKPELLDEILVKYRAGR